MLYNCAFTTYRREASGSARIHSATPTITNGSGFYNTVRSDLKAVYGLEDSLEVYQLLTQETDLKRGDKVVISSTAYYVHELEKINYGGTIYSKVTITINEQ